MNKTNTRNDFSRISPTAKLTAYWKSFSDIPYAKEIAEAVGSEETAKKMMVGRPEAMMACAASIFEIRYKAINYGLKKCGNSNVMELACGLSPRGLELVAKGGIYVGTDLPEMSVESSPVIMAIAHREGLQTENLYLQPANVMQGKELEDAAVHFGDKPFVVCNEGLLQYLTMEEKATMAQNLRNLLKGSKGCWITTDILYKEMIWEKLSDMFGTGEGKTTQEVARDFKDRTGNDIYNNDFPNKAAALKFYNDLGFIVEEFPMYVRDYALSTGSLIPDRFRENFLHIFASANAWILTPKT